MLAFFAALTAFVGAHLVPAIPPVRARRVALLGRGPYLAAYSLVSIALLGWVILSAQRAETAPLWEPAPWQWWVPLTVMPFALWLLLAGLLEPNPLSVSLPASPAGSEPGAIVAVTRHPVLWGFLLWALSHIPRTATWSRSFSSAAWPRSPPSASLWRIERPAANLARRFGPASPREPRWRRSAPFCPGEPSRPESAVLRCMPGASLALYAWLVLYGHAALIGVAPLAGI